MHKIHLGLILLTMLSTQQVFADDAMMMSTGEKPCAAVVNACLTAGFVRTEIPGKRFWADCMQPLLLNQPVQSVKIEAGAVQTCRADKIRELKKELNALQKAISK